VRTTDEIPLLLNVDIGSDIDNAVYLSSTTSSGIFPATGQVAVHELPKFLFVQHQFTTGMAATELLAEK